MRQTENGVGFHISGSTRNFLEKQNAYNKFSVLALFCFIVTLPACLPALAGVCDTVNTTLPVVTADTGSRVSGSGAPYVMNASYSSSTSVDVKGSFVKSSDVHAWDVNMLTFMIVNLNGVLYANNGQSWQAWDGNIDTLPIYSTIPSTTSEISLPINNGTLAPGTYQISFGYKQGADLPKPGCFYGYFYYYNATPIAVSVN